MAARFLTRSKTLTLTRILHPSLTSQQLRPLDQGRIPPPDSTSVAVGSAPRPDLAAAVDIARDLSAAPLGSRKILGYEQIPSHHLNKRLHASTQTLPQWFSGATRHDADYVRSRFYHSTENDKIGKTVGVIEEGKGANELDPLNGKEGECSKVISFSPLEGSYVKGRVSGLVNESLKIKRTELSQKITYALIPALLLVSKTTLTTSLLIVSVFWQIYGFFKEIFLDYVHQEVTRKWVLVYFKLLLLIVAKDMFLCFGLV